jgi:uncharacterized membrane protein YidH (DUF202 family)
MIPPAAARQQTALAWARTSLATGGFGIVMIRLGVQRHSTLDLLAALGLLGCGLLLAFRGHVLYQRPGAGPTARMLRLVTLAALCTGALVAVADVA